MSRIMLCFKPGSPIKYDWAISYCFYILNEQDLCYILNQGDLVTFWWSGSCYVLDKKDFVTFEWEGFCYVFNEGVPFMFLIRGILLNFELGGSCYVLHKWDISMLWMSKILLCFQWELLCYVLNEGDHVPVLFWIMGIILHWVYWYLFLQ